MGRVRLCRKTPLFVSLLLLFLSLLPAPPTPSPPSRLSLFLSNHLIQTSRTLHTKKKRGRVSRQHHIFFQRRQNRRSSSTQPPTTIHFGETIPIDSLPSAAVVFAPPSREHDSLRVQLVCVFFVFFFLPPFPVLPFLFGQKHARSHTSDLSLFLVRTREPYRLRWVSVRGRRLGELTIVRARASCSRTGRAAGEKGGSRFRFFSSRLVSPPKAVPLFS